MSEQDGTDWLRRPDRTADLERWTDRIFGKRDQAEPEEQGTEDEGQQRA